MFNRLWYFFSDYRVLLVIGVIAAAAVAYFGMDRLGEIGIWLVIVLLVALLLAGLFWLVRRLSARKAAKQLDGMVEGEAERAVATSKQADRAETEALRDRMLEAVKAIKSSRIGVLKGTAALYELPWYAIIGNPAAGKSSAILQSGLKFPFEDNKRNVIQGIGGTRNCDWYFTTEGIILDTAGRYSINTEDRSEWMTFLDLLRKHRPRAPLNGVIIAASIAELCGNKPEFAVDLAKNLRQRVQEITERLEVFVPVYVVFTKADLIAGFTGFFQGLDPSEREGVWGATLPYDPDGAGDALAAFDVHFDELSEGVKEMSLAHMAMQRGREVSPGLLTLPLEFVGIKPALRTFISTLFEDNPYQHKPVFRGFYFTSALQEGHSVHHASERITRQFGLQAGEQGAIHEPSGENAHFLKDLFRKVIFADKDLVRQYATPAKTRSRYGVFLAATAGLALLLGAWTWSYTTNRQLVENTTMDLQQAIRMQEDRFDLQSRIDALLLLQDRLEQLERFRSKGGVATRLGLYQGRRLEGKLRQEYFNGMRQIMVQPSSQRLEQFLGQVVAAGPTLVDDGGEASAEASAVLYQEASPSNVDDAYNALKTYLMLGDRSRVEQAQLSHQLTLFWRGWLDANRGQMTREDMARAAEKLMTFYVAQSGQPDWPQIETRMTLVGDARGVLRQVMKGQPAVERVLAQIKARAGTRFPTVTVASLVGDERNRDVVHGSYAISGAYSRQAWEQFVRSAIDEAASTQLNTTDWVLDTTEQRDLSQSGSPEYVARELATLYKQEYAREWLKFVQGIGVTGFTGFDEAVARMNSIGDAQNSPMRALLVAINDNTVWDNPSAQRELAGQSGKGFVAWFRRVILRQGTQPADSSHAGDDGTQGVGPVGKAFEGFARLMIARDNNPALVDSYFRTLGALRTRLNAIATEGDPGPGSRSLMQATLSNDGSELNAALTLVEEQMMTGLDEAQRNALRPLLLRPLTETFAALVPPAETEVNRAWSAQVLEPFKRGVGRQYPFNTAADVDAAAADVAAIFGASGAIAAFNREALGALVIQRGNLLEPRRWAGVGITLSPVLIAGYGDWVSGTGTAGDGPAPTIFQILPSPATGAVEYTLEIDGQTLRYRNTPPQWATFQWPNAGAVPGARLVAVTGDGRSVELVNAAGSNGLDRLLAAATITQGEDSSRVTWEQDGISITVVMRVNSRGGSGGGDQDWQRGLQLPEVVAGGQDVSPDAPAASVEPVEGE